MPGIPHPLTANPILGMPQVIVNASINLVGADAMRVLD
jgi:hypothetical protein